MKVVKYLKMMCHAYFKYASIKAMIFIAFAMIGIGAFCAFFPWKNVDILAILVLISVALALLFYVIYAFRIFDEIKSTKESEKEVLDGRLGVVVFVIILVSVLAFVMPDFVLKFLVILGGLLPLLELLFWIFRRNLL